MTDRNPGNGVRNMTSPRDNRLLIPMTMMERMSSSRALAQRWSTATGVSLSVLMIRLRMTILTLNHWCLRGLYSPNSASGTLIVKTSTSQMDHTTIWTITMYVYSSDVTERLLLKCHIQRHTGRTPCVIALDAIGYRTRFHLFQIPVSLNSQRYTRALQVLHYIREVVQHKFLYYLRRLPGAKYAKLNM